MPGRDAFLDGLLGVTWRGGVRGRETVPGFRSAQAGLHSLHSLMPASRATHTGFPMYHATIGHRRYVVPDLKPLPGKAPPLRSGDHLAGIAAESGEERVAAHYALADLP